MLIAGLTIPAIAQVEVGLWKSAGVSESYDRQSQGSVYPMTQRHDDGFIGCTWTNEDNYPFDGSSTPLRGVGYSYSTDGGFTWSWNDPGNPDYQQNRVGGIPVYWPSYAQWGANGEAILARSADDYEYNGVQIVNGLVLMTRPNKGQGEWTITPVPYPEGNYTPGVNAVMAWARMTTSGPNHQYIHIMSPMRTPLYDLMKHPVYYYRTQNGTTWDIEAALVTEMIGQDWGQDYTYTDGIDLAVRGNTVACSFMSLGEHGYVLKSQNNGDTWECIKFFDSPIRNDVTPAMYADTVYIPKQGCIALDNNGKIHVAFSVIMSLNTDSGVNYYLGMFTSFLSYWNENMAPIDGATDFVKHEIDPLLENYFDWDLSYDYYYYVNSKFPTWPIVGYFTPLYDDHYFNIDPSIITDWVGTSYGSAGGFSFPQMTVDDDNNVRLIYLGLVDNGYYNSRWLRHPFYTVSYNGGQNWTKTEYLVNYVAMIDQEFAYLTLAGFGEDRMYMVAQTDPFPGTHEPYTNPNISEHGAVPNNYTFFTVGGTLPPPPPACDPVTNAAATIEDDCTSATITWTPVDGAVEYEIRRNNVTLAKVTAPPYTDNFNFINGTTYTWSIKTICEENESWFTSVSVTADCAVCDPVTNAKAQIENCAKATLTWNAVAGAKEYEIRRDGNLLDKVTTTVFVETAEFENGKSYIWTIKAICNKESAVEVPASATADCEVCDPVTDAQAQIESCTTATITWTAVANAKGYEVRRDGNLLGTVTTPIFAETADFEHGKTYIWRIKTICNKTASGEISASAIADCTGITELANSVVIYPNPSNTSVTITAKNFAKVEIYNTIGQLIATTTENIVDVSHYNTGIYLFKVYDADGNSVTKRVMVSR